MVIEESRRMLSKAVELGVISEEECREKIKAAENHSKS